MKNGFQRKEMKYRLSLEQKRQLEQALADDLVPDAYPEYRLFSLYCDNERLDLLRSSSNRPAYREKVRIRSYQENPAGEDQVFLEVKKKIQGVTMKKRQSLPLKDVNLSPEAFGGPDLCSRDLKRITSRYALKPVLFLSYHRTSWFWKDDPDLRITFDEDVLFRTRNLVLARDLREDRLLLPEEETILEIKTSKNLPLKLVRILEQLKIKPASFSKAGRAYEMMIREEFSQNGTDNSEFSFYGAGQSGGRVSGRWCGALLL